MLRTLTYYWRINVAVMLGGAVATSVLTGALLVGDSVRASLRALTLDRLGNINGALVTESFFPQDLADRLSGSASTELVPVVLLRGAAVGSSGTRASKVSVIGIDASFPSLFPADERLGALFGERTEGQLFPSVVINESLRRELDLEPGDSLVLSFTRFSAVPRDSLLGDKDPDDVLARLRVSVTAVLDDRGAGRFGLSPHQATPLNAFVDLARLQRALGQDGEINGLLVASETAATDLSAALDDALRLEDYGLTVTRGIGHFDVGSRRM